MFVDVAKEYSVSEYTLFLGIFDKGHIQQVIQSPKSNLDDLEEESRTRLEGETCMASIKLSSDAVPLIDTFEVSALPWAIGRVSSSGLDSLTSEAFEKSRRELERDLSNFMARRVDKDSQKAFRADEVETLINLLSDWSGFYPDKSHSAALLEVQLRKKKTSEETAR